MFHSKDQTAIGVCQELREPCQPLKQVYFNQSSSSQPKHNFLFMLCALC